MPLETTTPRRSWRRPRGCSGLGRRVIALRSAGRSRFGFAWRWRRERGKRFRLRFGAVSGGASTAGSASAASAGASAAVSSSGSVSGSASASATGASAAAASASTSGAGSASATSTSSSSSVRSLRPLARKEIGLPLDDPRLDRQLPAREPERLFRQRLGHAGQLEHDAAGLDHSHPVLRGALAGAHPCLGGLLRHRLVREDVDPDLAAAADLARHRNSGGLDLAVRHPTVLERLQSEVAGLYRRLALCEATSAASLVFAEFGLLGEKHLALVFLLRRALGGRLLGRARLLRRRLLRGRRLARRGPRLALLGALVARLVELRRVLVHLLLGRRVGRVGDSRGGLLDLRLDHRLLAPLGGDALLVRARLLDGLGRHLLDDGSLVAGGTSHSLRATFPL